MVKGIKKDTHSHLRNPAMDEKLQKVVLQNLVVPKSNAKCMKTQKEPTSHAKQVFSLFRVSHIYRIKQKIFTSV